MADSAQVEQAIVNLIGAALYPNGTTQPSIIGPQVSVARGWPTEATVSEATNAGNVIIAVHASKGFSRDSTRYARDWHVLTQNAPTLTAALNGAIISLSGTVTAGNAIGVLSQGSAYTYVATATDTLSTIASNLAASIPNATASGSTVTLPSGGALPAVAVVNGGVSAQEVSRQQANFAVDVWAATPALRDAAFGVIPGALAQSYRLTAADGTTATLMKLTESGPDDVPSREKMFRRNIQAIYDWPVIVTAQTQAVAAVLQNYTLNGGAVLPFATV